MFINIALLLLVFGATKWKKMPYAGAAVFGLVKGVLYFIGAFRQASLGLALFNGVLGLVLFGGLAVVFIHLLRRLDHGEVIEANYASPGTEKTAFRWEYTPLTVVLLCLIFGEMILTFLF